MNKHEKIEKMIAGASPVAQKSAEAQPPEFSEEALALRFAEQHAGKLRYVAKWGKWLRWTGHRWEEEDTLYTFDLARALCREESARCNKPGTAKTLASAKTRAAVVSLAREDRRLAATVDQWDIYPWLLNTPDGVIDLRTGNMREHRPEDYITKLTAVAPGGECPLWLRFLDTVAAGDQELQAYLQRALGYTLTGSVTEHALFFLYGMGANGKGTLLNTVAAICRDYCKTASVETFTVSAGDRHPADLAALRGARLVITSETEEGHRWAESRIKLLTGGDTVSARFMRQDFFEYTPQFKLFFMGNHKPGLRATNEAIRRRINLLPFEVVIPRGKRDSELPEKLRQEWPGILAWMIAGCLEWQRVGLMPPERVTRATDDYLEAEDVISAWIEDCCHREPCSHTPTYGLFDSWEAWAQQTGTYVGNVQRLAGKLEDAGYRRERVAGVRGFWGLRLKGWSKPQSEMPY